MAATPDKPAPSDHPTLPPRLSARLNEWYGSPVVVPPAVDDAILREARAGFARRRRFALAVRWAGSLAAAAAAVAVVAVVLHRNRPGPHVAVNSVPALAGDVDGSGRVDMLDALLLARKVEANAASNVAGADKAGDFNGDGVLDGRDVDAVANLAVRLPGGAQ